VLYSNILLDGTESAIQGVLWTVLAVFFVLTILSWLAANREWLKEEEPAATENREEQSDDPKNVRES
jgi:hypothetical protein